MTKKTTTMNKSYVLPLDEKVNERLMDLLKQFAPTEKIVSTNASEGKLIVVTEILDSKNNLLLG